MESNRRWKSAYSSRRIGDSIVLSLRKVVLIIREFCFTSLQQPCNIENEEAALEIDTSKTALRLPVKEVNGKVRRYHGGLSKFLVIEISVCTAPGLDQTSRITS
jgi:hypothetical protein